jgi:hypothetical protein
VARGIQTREQGENWKILAFRVDRYDRSGNRIDPVAVELRGYRSGQVNEGEEVEVSGKWSHGTLRANKVVNLSTNAEVEGGLSKGHKFGLAFFLLWILGIIAIAVVLLLVVR